MSDKSIEGLIGFAIGAIGLAMLTWAVSTLFTFAHGMLACGAVLVALAYMVLS